MNPPDWQSENGTIRLYLGDCYETLWQLPAASVQTCVTSPPYWGLRDYGVGGQLGLEPTPDEYVTGMVNVFREVRRVLRDDGTVWLNLGDSYVTTSGGGQQVAQTNTGAGLAADRVPAHRAGLKPKDLCGIPWRVALALQADGWWLRQDIIWHKPNPMPESVTDRPTKAHEYIFLLSKGPRYYYDHEAVKEPAINAGRLAANGGADGMDEGYDGHRTREGLRRGIVVAEDRNRRSVWTVPTQPFTGWTQTSRLVRVGLGDVSDGMTRIESPDCPVHGCQDHPNDGHAADQIGRNRRSSHPDQLPLGEQAGNSQSHEQMNLVSNSDSPPPKRAKTATCHSKQNRKTDHAPSTNQPCTLSDETQDSTERKSETPTSVEPQPNTPESRTWPDEMDADLPDQTLRHIVRMSSLPVSPECRCGFYQETAKKTNHFATFPPKLIEPCILAGCPVGGTVLDPFTGSGTVGMVAAKHGRKFVGIELNPEYLDMAAKRCQEGCEAVSLFNQP